MNSVIKGRTQRRQSVENKTELKVVQCNLRHPSFHSIPTRHDPITGWTLIRLIHVILCLTKAARATVSRVRVRSFLGFERVFSLFVESRLIYNLK